jgi:Putative transposase
LIVLGGLSAGRCPERGLPDGNITCCFRKTSKYSFVVQQGELYWTHPQPGKITYTPDIPLGDARTFQRFLAPLWHQPWVVYAKPPFASAQHVLSYLGRYTHRVALSNDRLVALRDGQVVFRWHDRRRRNRPKLMTVAVEEFIRRFLLHVLPAGFLRIRHYGVLGNRCRTSKLVTCRRLLAQPVPPVLPRESAATMMRRLTGIDIERCPQCHQGRLVVIATQQPLRLPGLVSETARPP